MSRAGDTPAASTASPDSRLHRRYLVFAVCLCLFIVAMGALERMGMPRLWIGVAFMAGTVLIYAGIGFLSRTSDEAEYYVAGRRVPAVYNGMATAADWMSVASFIGTAGVLYLNGFGGLAYILGWTGGYCLVALLLAPYLRRLGQYTVADFLGARYGGTAPRLIGALATVMVSFVYVVAQLYGVGLIASHLLGLGFEVGIFIGLGGVLVCSFLGGMRAVTWTQVAQYIVLIVAYLVPVVWLGLKQPAMDAPVLGYGGPLAVVTEREQALLADPREREVMALWQARAAAAAAQLRDVPAAMRQEARELAAEAARLRAEGAPLARIQQVDRQLRLLPRTEAQARQRYERARDDALQRARPLGGMAPQAQPFPRGDPAGDARQRELYRSERMNFVALVFCLMLGTAAMPHVLARYYTTTTPQAARRSVGWSLFFITVLYLAAPAMAVLVKAEVLVDLIGLPFDQLPAWVRRWSRLDGSLVSVEDINGDGVLQLGELRLGSDVIVLLAPEIGGLPFVVSYLVAAGGLAAALSTADGLLLSISSALSHDIYYRVLDPRAPAMRRVIISKALVLLVAASAATVASLKVANVVHLVAAAFSIAASALFAPLVLGVFWRRATRWGAVAGMAAGLATCFYYMLVNLPWSRQWLGLARPLAETRWWDVDATSAGFFGVPASVAAMALASLLTRRDGPQQMAVLDRLRRP
ncbi:MAG: VC_2705 family sodium/solute symporter [Rubrivivax sp.]